MRETFLIHHKKKKEEYSRGLFCVAREMQSWINDVIYFVCTFFFSGDLLKGKVAQMGGERGRECARITTETFYGGPCTYLHRDTTDKKRGRTSPSSKEIFSLRALSVNEIWVLKYSLLSYHVIFNIPLSNVHRSLQLSNKHTHWKVIFSLYLNWV